MACFNARSDGLAFPIMATTPADPSISRPFPSPRVPIPNGELDEAKRELLQAQIRLARAKVAVIDAAADIKMLSAKVRSLVR